MNYLTISFTNAAYVIFKNFKTTTYYGSIFFIKADVYLHHVTVMFDANEMIATLKNM